MKSLVVGYVYREKRSKELKGDICTFSIDESFFDGKGFDKDVWISCLIVDGIKKVKGYAVAEWITDRFYDATTRDEIFNDVKFCVNEYLQLTREFRICSD